MKSTLYFGGEIITMEEPLVAEAVLTQDGKISAIGKKSDLEKQYPSAVLKDLQGRTMIPSFIDAHSHITAYATALALADLSSAKSFDDIQKLLLKFVQKADIKEGEWVVGFGYDNAHFAKKEHPDKFVLDNLGLKNPILITHTSGHMGVLNSTALELVGITEQTPDPSGGKIGRVQNTQVPNGFLEETAFISLAGKAVQFDSTKKKKLMEKAQKIYVSYGITTIQDGLVNTNELDILKSTDLFLDVVGYIDINKAPNLLEETKECRKKYKNHLKIQGIKLFCDGSPQGRTAWLTKPYENAKDGYKGYPIYTDEEVTRFFKIALQQNIQILVHCNGDAAAEQFIRCYKTAKQEYPQAEVRPVMIHAQMLPVSLLPEIKRLHIIPSYFVAHVYYWGDTHIENLGDRAYQISPANSTEKLDIPYTFHQDSPVIEPNMLKTIWCAVNRITRNGILLGKEERITPLQALKAVTIHSAYQYFEEDIKGSIAPGKEANFTILSQNPLKAAPMQIDKIQVLETIFKDKVVFKKETI